MGRVCAPARTCVYKPVLNILTFHPIHRTHRTHHTTRYQSHSTVILQLPPRTNSTMSSFKSSISSSSSSSSSSFVSTINGNRIRSFEKKRKELSNGTQWVLRLISPIVKPVSHSISKFRGKVLICRVIRIK